MFIGHQKHALILSIVWTFTFGAVIDQASIGAGDLNEDVFLGEDSDTSSSLEGVGEGVDSGPSDVGHELHAKMEEAVEKAQAIIEHAGKYLAEAEKEQTGKAFDSVDDLDKDQDSSWNKARSKRETPAEENPAIEIEQSVEQLHELDSFPVESAAVKGPSKDYMMGDDAEEAPEDNDSGTDELSAIPTEKIDMMIEYMNKLNKLFASFISKWDSTAAAEGPRNLSIRKPEEEEGEEKEGEGEREEEEKDGEKEAEDEEQKEGEENEEGEEEGEEGEGEGKVEEEKEENEEKKEEE